MSLEIIVGDLFEAKEQYIAHQCNCVMSKSAHLAASMFKRFPYSDVYTGRKEFDKPGTIKICGDGIAERFVIAMFGQFYPGKVRYPDSQKDGFKAREGYFLNCLRKISKIKGIETIAFPFGIGCGAAGGNWEKYLEMITLLADKTDIQVKIYRL